MDWKRRLQRWCCWCYVCHTLYLKFCKFTLNTFYDFVFTYFKQEQQYLWNFRLLKLLFAMTKLKTVTKCFRYFRLQKYRHRILVKRSFTKTFNDDFRPLPPWQSLKSWYLHGHCRSCWKYVNTKSLNIFKVNFQGSKSKRIRPYHGCHYSPLACSSFLRLSMVRSPSFITYLG